MSEECIICMEEGDPSKVEGNRLIRLCMSECECNGFIHKECLKKWVLRNPPVHSGKCPICRTNGENFTLLECGDLITEKDVASASVSASASVNVSVLIPVTNGHYQRMERNNSIHSISRQRQKYAQYCALFSMIGVIILIFVMTSISEHSN